MSFNPKQSRACRALYCLGLKYLQKPAGLFGHPGKWYQRVNDTQELPLMLQTVLPLCLNKPSIFIILDFFISLEPLALGPSDPHASGSKLHYRCCWAGAQDALLSATTQPFEQIGFSDVGSKSKQRQNKNMHRNCFTDPIRILSYYDLYNSRALYVKFLDNINIFILTINQLISSHD